jgi:cytochrome-b5 reductase
MLNFLTNSTQQLQLLRKVMNNPEDKTRVNLLFCNSTEDDILLREELEKIANENPDRFKVTYSLTKPPVGWKGETGRVSSDMVKKHMPEPTDKSMIFVCGPDGMVQTVSNANRGREKTGILQE